jgi:hypothetical protein
MRNLLGAVMAAMLVFLAVSCGDKGVPPGEEKPTSSLEIIAGNNQVGAAKTFLPDSMTVRVVNSVGTPVAGDTIRFTQITPKDSAQIFFEEWPTDAQGFASVRYRVDATVGVDTIMAISDAAGDTAAVYFEITVVAGPAMFIEKVSPLDVAVTTAGEPLADSIVVMTTDLYGNPTGGEIVSFVGSNRCVVATDSTDLRPFETDSAHTASDVDGLAAAEWILSINPGIGYPAFHQLTVFFQRYDSVEDTIFSDSVNFAAQALAPGTMEYYYDIRPIFDDNCFQCHGQAADTGYRLDYYYLLVRDDNMVPGDTNSPILAEIDPNNHFGNANTVEEDKVIRWVVTDNGVPGSSGLNNYNDHMKSIIDASCITCHGDVAPDGNYTMTSHLSIRGGGLDAVPNAIPGADTSLLVQKMQERHYWSYLDPDSTAAAVLADSVIIWTVDDFMREY